MSRKASPEDWDANGLWRCSGPKADTFLSLTVSHLCRKQMSRRKKLWADSRYWQWFSKQSKIYNTQPCNRLPTTKLSFGILILTRVSGFNGGLHQGSTCTKIIEEWALPVPKFWNCPLAANTSRTMEEHAELPGKIQLLKKLYFNLEVLLAGDKEKKWKKKKALRTPQLCNK